MKVHELIEELQKIPNQNRIVITFTSYGDVGDVEIADAQEFFTPSGNEVLIYAEDY